MVSKAQSGFTLIEIIFVLAISSAMFISILAGERFIRSRAQFDAAINRAIASANEARSMANSVVNAQGDGTGAQRCPQPGAPNGNGTFPYSQYIFAGTEWIASRTAPMLRINSWKAIPGTAWSCTFKTTQVDVLDGVYVSSPGPQGGRVLFLRNDNGTMTTCFMTDTATSAATSFANGSCPNALTTQDFTLTDNNGHAATITIDSSGIARRK